MMKYFLRGLLVIVVVAIGWRVITTGLAQHYLDEMRSGDTASIERVLTWAPRQPEALLERALSQVESDPVTALPLLEKAYQVNPTDARALLAVAVQLAEMGDRKRADALVAIADRLEPSGAFIQQPIAAYWARHGEPEKAISHLSKVLIADADQGGELFPVLLAVAESPGQRELLKRFVDVPPSWWPAFFRFVAENAESSDTVRFLFNLRRQSALEPLDGAERAAYRSRLMRDGRITEAYLVWVNGLDEQARGVLGLLYNGGFELPISNAGFGWHARSHRRAAIATMRTLGAGGDAALRLRFQAFEGRFRQLWQPLFLDAGTYRVVGRVRSESLRTQGGLRWRVSCVLPIQTVLGESTPFLGSSEWDGFSFEFKVPDECRAQELRLVSAGRRTFELKIDGIVWFDDLQIRRIASLTAAAKADEIIRRAEEESGSTPPLRPSNGNGEPVSAAAIPDGASRGADAATDRVDERADTDRAGAAN